MYLYGYTVNEFKFAEIKPVKDSLKFTRIMPNPPVRKPLSTSLPFCLLGATPPRPEPCDAASYVGGALKRMGREPPPMTRRDKRDFKRFVGLWLKRNLIPITDDKVPTFEEWLSGTDYTKARKEELTRVWDKAGRVGRRSKLRKVKSFIKDEAYPEPKYPRLINSRVDEAKCAFGPICKAASDVVFSLPMFIKNTPVADRPMVIRDTIFKDGGKYESTDYTSYEAHFTKERIDMTTGLLFRHLFKRCSNEIRRAVELMLKTLTGKNIIMSKLVSFIINATRCSGEMDTSLSNGFANAMTIEYLAWKVGGKVEYAVEGDDGLMRWIGDAKPTPQDYLDLGLDIKIETSDEISHLSFCGMVYDVEELIVVTDIREVLCRLGWTNKQYVNASDQTKLQLLRAKGFSLAYQYNGCPVLSRLGRKIIALTSDIQIRESIVSNWDTYHRRTLVTAMTSLPDERLPGPRTRQLISDLYQISEREQLQLENWVDNLEIKHYQVPFQVPEVWCTYFARYSSELHDEDPVWLRKNRASYLKYISGFSNLKSFDLT